MLSLLLESDDIRSTLLQWVIYSPTGATSVL